MGNAARIRRARRGDRFDLDEVEPIQLDDDEEPEDEEVELIHVFSIGDKAYYMPTKVEFVHSARSMEIYAQQGEAAAVAYQLRVTLGDEGYEALINYPKLREAKFRAIIDLANKIINAGSGKAP